MEIILGIRMIKEKFDDQKRVVTPLKLLKKELLELLSAEVLLKVRLKNFITANHLS